MTGSPGHDDALRHELRRLLEASPMPLTESLALLRLVNTCPYRSRDAACGCSGARCGLRAAVVNHINCLECMRTHGLA
jgi:hypothetical protein